MTEETKDEFAAQDQDELSEIHDFDFGRAVMLMSIAEKVSTVAPKATSLLGIAQAELEFMNQQAKDIARRRADRAREADERARQAEQDRLNAEADEANAEADANERPGPRAIPSQAAPVQQPGMPAPTRRV
jgi:uncharacterized protein YlxW (UPF0749 family)